MPIIRVEMFPGRTAQQKAAFAAAVTKSFAETCLGKPESVHVLFQEVEQSDWAVAGTLVSEKAAIPPAAPAKPAV